MLDPSCASLAGLRRHDLPRSTSQRALSPAPATAKLDLADAVDRHLATARRMQQPMAVLSVGLRRCLAADDQLQTHPQAQWLETVALEMSQRLRARVRRSDTVLWSMGREFAVVLQDCRQPLALAVQKRLLTGVQGVYRLGPMAVQADVAIGCACHPAAGDSGAALLAAAQHARGPLGPDDRLTD